DVPAGRISPDTASDAERRYQVWLADLHGAVGLASVLGPEASRLRVRFVPQQVHRGRLTLGQHETELHGCGVVADGMPPSGVACHDEALPGREADLLEVEGVPEGREA